MDLAAREVLCLRGADRSCEFIMARPASPSHRLAGQTRAHAVGSRCGHDRGRIKIFHQLCARSAVIVTDERGGMKRGPARRVILCLKWLAPQHGVFQWRKFYPAIAPAGSNRSSDGGDEIAEAFAMHVTKWC
jgi:hypothetical protein